MSSSAKWHEKRMYNHDSVTIPPFAGSRLKCESTQTGKKLIFESRLAPVISYLIITAAISILFTCRVAAAYQEFLRVHQTALVSTDFWCAQCVVLRCHMYQTSRVDGNRNNNSYGDNECSPRLSSSIGAMTPPATSWSVAIIPRSARSKLHTE